MEKKEKFGLIANIIFAALIVVADLLYIYVDLPAFYLKTQASLLFVLMGLFNFIYALKTNNKKYFKFNLILLIGLVFAMIGDILLIKSNLFIMGAIFFAIGHIFFFVAFTLLSKFKVRDIIIGLIIFACALMIIIFYPGFEFGGMLPMIIAYALIISLMLGKALSNVFEKENKLANIIIALGAFLFFFSDVMLVFNVFAGGGFIFDFLCLITYYPAEALLASSMYILTLKNTKSVK